MSTHVKKHDIKNENKNNQINLYLFQFKKIKLTKTEYITLFSVHKSSSVLWQINKSYLNVVFRV